MYRHCDYTLGIFQSIGFKEFHDYVTLSEVERESEAGQKLLLEGCLLQDSVAKGLAIFAMFVECVAVVAMWAALAMKKTPKEHINFIA